METRLPEIRVGSSPTPLVLTASALAALVEEVARDAAVQEEEEAFAIERVAAGESSIGVFPLSAERRPEFEAWKAARRG